MKSVTHRGPIVFVLLAVLLAGLATVATADDQQPMTTEEKSAALEAAAAQSTEESPATQVYNMNGVRITWDTSGKVYRSPTADEMAALSEQFNKWVEARIADGHLPAQERVQVKTLDNGMKTAKLPAHFLSAAVVRFDESGKLVTDCADGAEATGNLLRQQVSSTEQEDK